ncbi:hypothetical protein [Mycolicibacterium wolinskyi]|uniref:hypothetical protein n=1 Tax=Mycolicibacterium wolinskyi TaxID=59750 RepID=UPI003917761D
MPNPPTPNNMPGAQQAAAGEQPQTPPPGSADPAAGQAPADGATPTPPWGADNTKYDPDKAAQLIANLRSSETTQAGTIKTQKDRIAELESQLADAKPLLDAHTEQQRREQGEVATLRQDMAGLQQQLTTAQQTAQDNLNMALAAKAEALASNRDASRAGSAFVNPATAVKLIDLSDCLTGDGKIDDKAIAAKLDALAQSEPYLVAAATNGGRKPNPAQGQGGGAIPLDAQIKDAEQRGDVMRSIALKQQQRYQR